MILLGVFFSAMLLVVIVCPVAWLILSRWLDGRSLIIATVAVAVAFGMGGHTYFGPLDEAALVALAGFAGSLLSGILIAKIWLARAAKNNGLIDG